jgi:hypothetical protein
MNVQRYRIWRVGPRLFARPGLRPIYGDNLPSPSEAEVLTWNVGTGAQFDGCKPQRVTTCDIECQMTGNHSCTFANIQQCNIITH